jgi:hypothetical protein
LQPKLPQCAAVYKNDMSKKQYQVILIMNSGISVTLKITMNLEIKYHLQEAHFIHSGKNNHCMILGFIWHLLSLYSTTAMKPKSSASQVQTK